MNDRPRVVIRVDGRTRPLVFSRKLANVHIVAHPDAAYPRQRSRDTLTIDLEFDRVPSALIDLPYVAIDLRVQPRRGLTTPENPWYSSKMKLAGPPHAERGDHGRAKFVYRFVGLGEFVRAMA
jgi:hypothetical protein